MGCAFAAGLVINVQVCEISDWTVAFYLGTIVYGMSVIYRAVRCMSRPSGSARRLGLLNLLRRRHRDDG